MEKKRDKKPILQSHQRLAESLKKAANSANTRKLLLDEELFALEDTERSLRSNQIVTLQWPYEFKEAFESFLDEGPLFLDNLKAESIDFDEELDLLDSDEPIPDPSSEKEYEEITFYAPPIALPTWRFRLSDGFIKSITKLDKKLQGRILGAISKLTKSPMTPTGNTIKPLTKSKSGLWRYRVGDYRLIYSPHEREREIVLISFMPRGSAYA